MQKFINISTGILTILALLFAGAVAFAGNGNPAGQPPVVVSGAVTANAGTNLNTSALALETGGNLAILAGAISSNLYQVNLSSLGGVALGAMANYGTSPGAVKVQGVNAFVTNTIAATVTNTTASNLNAAVVGTGTAGSAAGGVLTVQGSASGTAIPVSLSGNQAINVAQIAASTVATAATGVQKVGIVGNAGAIFDQATGSAVPANALYEGINVAGNIRGLTGVNPTGTVFAAQTDLTSVAGTTTVTGTGAAGAGVQRVTVSNDSSLAANQSVNMNQIGGTAVVADPCQANAKTSVAISQTANTQIIAGTSAKKTYICSIMVVGADAENISLVEGTVTVCGTGTAAVIGGTTAANGPNMAANGGFTMGNGAATVAIASNANADNVCLFQSGSGRIAGVVTYVQQ